MYEEVDSNEEIKRVLKRVFITTAIKWGAFMLITHTLSKLLLEENQKTLQTSSSSRNTRI